jgi:DNA-binding transcriptional LysR family regulator
MDASPTGSGAREPFRVAYVRGVTPAKWVRIWGERRPDRPIELLLTDADQVQVLRDGRARMAFVRLPVEGEGLNIIPLYAETAVAVASKDHAASAVDSLELADLDGETIYDATGDIDETFALVAAGVGIAIVPQSIARLHARRDVVARPVTDAPSTSIALAWPADANLDADAAAIEEFIGIVRGRTERSSRGPSTAEEPKPARGSSRGPGKPARKPSAKSRPRGGRRPRH